MGYLKESYFFFKWSFEKNEKPNILYIKYTTYNMYIQYARVLSHFSCVRLYATLWTATCQPPLSMGFSRQEYWSGLLCLPPSDLLDSGIEPASLTSI